MRFILQTLSLLLIIATLSVACSKEESAPNAKTLKVHIFLNPSTLDPRKGRSLYDLNVPRMLFEGLTRIDADGTPILAAASNVQISDEGKVYTFTLRDSFWSNGEAVTSYDFKHAWVSSLTPNFPSPMANQLYIIKGAQEIKEDLAPISSLGVETPDAKTLVVTLKEATPYFLELTASSICFPVHKDTDLKFPDWYHTTGSSFPVNGPFTLKSWEPDNLLVLEKNTHYWNHKATHLDAIEFAIGGDVQTSLSLFERKQLDWVGSPLSQIPQDAIPELKKRDLLHFKPIAGTGWYLFNTEAFPCNNVHFRKALAYAIDRRKIIDHVLQGDQAPAFGILPPTMKTKSPTFPDGSKSLAQKELKKALEELNLSSPKDLGDIVITYVKADPKQKIAEVIQQTWEEDLGLTVKLRGLEGKTFYQTRASRDFQICGGNWLGDFNDPMNFLELFESRKNPINATFWESKRYQTKLQQIRSTQNLKMRKKLCGEADQILIEEMPLIPTFHIALAYARRDDLEDVVLTPTGFIDFTKAKLK